MRPALERGEGKKRDALRLRIDTRQRQKGAGMPEKRKGGGSYVRLLTAQEKEEKKEKKKKKGEEALRFAW